MPETLARLRQVTQQLEEQEAYLALALEMAHIGTWKWDPIADIITWDDQCRSIFGVKEMTRDSLATELMAEQDRDRFNRILDHCVETGETFDIQYTIKNGKTRHVHVRGKMHGEYMYGICMSVNPDAQILFPSHDQ